MYSLKSDKLPFHQRNKFIRMTLDILKEMANVSLLGQNLGFLLITLSNFCLFTGYFLPFIYLGKIAEETTKMDDPTLLYSLIGNFLISEVKAFAPKTWQVWCLVYTGSM